MDTAVPTQSFRQEVNFRAWWGGRTPKDNVMESSGNVLACYLRCRALSSRLPKITYNTKNPRVGIKMILKHRKCSFTGPQGVCLSAISPSLG